MRNQIVNFKKSDVAYLANMVVNVLDNKVEIGTVISADLILFDSSETKTTITTSVKVTGDVTYLNVMQMLRRKLSAYITLKAARMNLVLRFGDKTADSGLFTMDYLFTGKKINRYKVFNGLFILSAASHEQIEVVPTDNGI